jgi:hypothetical protein
MSIFSKIKDAIFGHPVATEQASAAPTASGVSSSGVNTGATTSSGQQRSAPVQAVDVAAVLDRAVADKKQKLQWRTSIVDLMKALDLDSSLAARKELAQDLNYQGDTNDSAAMNMWLHKQVMQKLAENGGKVPESLRT